MKMNQLLALGGVAGALFLTPTGMRSNRWFKK